MSDINEEVARRIKTMREERGWTQKHLSMLLGLNAETAINNYEKGRSLPKDEIKYKLCELFGCSMDYLMGKEAFEKATQKQDHISKSVLVNVYGTIPAGIPLEMIEDILDTEEISSDDIRGDKQFFALKIKGSSMEPEYRNNDIVIFEKIDDCESGDDCVVMVNGNEGTFKRVIKEKDGITLKPLNQQFSPMHFTNEQIRNLPIRILGRFYELRRKRKWNQIALKVADHTTVLQKP